MVMWESAEEIWRLCRPPLNLNHARLGGSMQQGNRVLARTLARVLTDKEMQSVSGGAHTATKCTVLADKFADGDTGEC